MKLHIEPFQAAKTSPRHTASRSGLLIFALIVASAPLLFGAVDRIVQVLLTALLGVGVLLAPPKLPKPGRFALVVVGVFVAILLVKEFAPFSWFGDTKWHRTIVGSFEVQLGKAHNPEPARAIDALLVACVACVWFLWVRGLAAQGGSNRNLLAWMVFGAAAVLAFACLTMANDVRNYIYGLRYTPGWMGYGPFPNKNHTASFLAMGALIGAGCITRAGGHRRFALVALGAAFVAAILVALFESKSRGGLIAFGIGFGVYAIMALVRIRNFRTIGITLAALLVAAGLLMAFGSKLLTRFNAASEGNIPSNLRWSIWSDAIAMWRDARIFGHGLGSFTQLFPIYQQVQLENRVVLHPESSWLQWLVELGAVPLLLLVVVLVVFVGKSVCELFERHHGFFIRAGALSALVALLVHAMWDVPAHRWGTAGLGIALLAIACPPRARERIALAGRGLALVPILIAAFWSLPFLANWPSWSPTSLTLLLEKTGATAVSLTELQNAENRFPLSADLQHALGMRLLNEPAQWAQAWPHFRVADRLKPGSWSMPALQAQAARPFSHGMALHYWTLAVERAGTRDELVFIKAWRATAGIPGAESYWSRFVENHPCFMLTLANMLPDKAGEYLFLHWWKGSALKSDPQPYEVKHFYDLAWRYGKATELRQWIEHHPKLEARDYRVWAKVLHELGDDATAWRILSRNVAEPEFPQVTDAATPDVMETTWLINPQNTLNAQNLAVTWLQGGQHEKGRKLILKVGAQADSPAWFLRKAAYLLAADGNYSAAVASILRER